MQDSAGDKAPTVPSLEALLGMKPSSDMTGSTLTGSK